MNCVRWLDPRNVLLELTKSSPYKKKEYLTREKYEIGDFFSTDRFICNTTGRFPNGCGRESLDNHFQGGTIYNDSVLGLIWVENQVFLCENETVMGEQHFEQ